MNIYDVSQKAGVSIATVSRVMNENSNVSDKTKQKVIDTMKELGYTPNIFARGLSLNTMKTIGIMCADSSDSFLANAVYYLEQNLHKQGYDSFLCCTGYELQSKKKYLKLLQSKRVDAIIMVGSYFLESTKKDNQYIIEAAKDLPIMMINGYLKCDNVYCVLCDDYQTVYDTMHKLIINGRKKIMYLYNTKSYSGIQKIKGYKDALSAHKLSFHNEYLQLCDKDILSTKETLLSLYHKGIKFDAIVCSEDILAIGAIKFANQVGLFIPKDVHIIGYNNSLLALCCEPELSSIDNHVETLCITTTNHLMRVLEGSDVPNKTTISNDLILRETTNFN